MPLKEIERLYRELAKLTEQLRSEPCGKGRVRLWQRAIAIMQVIERECG